MELNPGLCRRIINVNNPLAAALVVQLGFFFYRERSFDVYIPTEAIGKLSTPYSSRVRGLTKQCNIGSVRINVSSFDE